MGSNLIKCTTNDLWRKTDVTYLKIQTIKQGDIYGVGYNGEYKLKQNEAEGANIDWPGIKISLN